MNRVPTEKRIVLLDFEFFRFQFLISSGRVARRRFAFLARFRAFDCDDFSRHKLFLFLDWLLFGFFSVILRISAAGGINGA